MVAERSQSDGIVLLIIFLLKLPSITSVLAGSHPSRCCEFYVPLESQHQLVSRSLLRKSEMKPDPKMQPIQLILSDVDGVLTDGGITYDNQGIETKRFNVRDGMGIKLWQRAGHKFGIITARSSHIVKLRSTELGIEIVRQGLDDKLPSVMQIIEELGLKPENVCYIGDDLTDLAVITSVGLGASVADGAKEVRDAAHFVTKTAGGQGAMRELIETILKSQKRWDEVVSHYAMT